MGTPNGTRPGFAEALRLIAESDVPHPFARVRHTGRHACVFVAPNDLRRYLYPATLDSCLAAARAAHAEHCAGGFYADGTPLMHRITDADGEACARALSDALMAVLIECAGQADEDAAVATADEGDAGQTPDDGTMPTAAATLAAAPAV